MIRRLSEAGIPVGVSVAPVAPFVNEPELETVLAAAHEAGARHAQYMVLRLPHELADVFTDWLRAHYPDRAERVLNRLREMRRDEGGQADRINDPRFFTRMKGTGKWAQLIAMRFDLATRKLGFHQERVELRCDLFQPPSVDGQMGLFAPGAPAR
jgi:DNA repair photolyase